ncbi:MAG TPA: SpoIID/LytB domain-containing protein [Gemmatimonadales bacterium]|nr:SpoIID/LytB domain-containing protein [Gemmatimonadota bacterium]HPF62944.1 SpoIID/LytB domain-containing protein [Gemmatimonadales bacterium]HRX18290.1 SpoIID/LytB domain-containing protein [Gemmatimonadales bacterium]
MPPDQPAVQPAAESRQPLVRIGLSLDAPRPRFSGDMGLRVTDPDEGDLRYIGAGDDVRVGAQGNGVVLDPGGRELRRRVFTVTPGQDEGLVYLDGRPYRGAIEVSRGADGVRVVNIVGLEEYLVAVVGAELGHRPASEAAAARAQAVVARTYALRNMGRWEADGFDLLAGVASQVYRGADDEDPVARAAVEATAGEVLLYGGDLIDAFYSSTCGGSSEAGRDVFVDGDRPYLQARPDVDGEGRAWCAISPRFRWTTSWSAAELAAILRRTLAAERLATAVAADLREMRVLDRTASGRIATLELRGARGATVVRGSAIRRALQPPEGGLLGSSDFTVRLDRRGGRIERVVAEGRGFGHGVGLCQWGAIGRARAGQDHLTILMSYFPGTDLQRIY